MPTVKTTQPKQDPTTAKILAEMPGKPIRKTAKTNGNGNAKPPEPKKTAAKPAAAKPSKPAADKPDLKKTATEIVKATKLNADVKLSPKDDYARLILDGRTLAAVRVNSKGINALTPPYGKDDRTTGTARQIAAAIVKFEKSSRPAPKSK